MLKVRLKNPVFLRKLGFLVFRWPVVVKIYFVLQGDRIVPLVVVKHDWNQLNVVRDFFKTSS